MRAVLRQIGRFALIAGIAALAAIGHGLYRDATGPGPLAASHTVVIPPHTGLSGVASLLVAQGIVRHELTFEVSAVLAGRRSALKAGEYTFPAATSPLQALNLLASGKTVQHRLEIPDGLTSAQIAVLVRAAPALVGDVGLLPGEGALMPDTYFYKWGERRRRMLARMHQAMARAVARVWAHRLPDLPLQTPRQLVILASLVDKEAAGREERARIAGVFLNRLRRGMPLQSDPTVIYAVSDGGRKPFARSLTRADLAIDSPYNTYLVRGLPPGPIDNPGLGALRAAARPVTSQDLYFVADGAGGHRFAKTLDEHHRNVALYRRALAARDAAAHEESPASK